MRNRIQTVLGPLLKKDGENEKFFYVHKKEGKQKGGERVGEGKRREEENGDGKEEKRGGGGKEDRKAEVQ